MLDDLQRRLAAEGLDPGFWSNGPGFPYLEHDHPYDKVIVVEAGSIRFGLPMQGEWIVLEAGDRLELPAHTPHQAVVGPAGVRCLEAHLPMGHYHRAMRHPAGSW